MGCLRSFNMYISGVANFSSPETKTWADLNNKYFAFESSGKTSTFDLTGFKNIDVYGMAVNGYIANRKNSLTGAATILDWNSIIFINGIAPGISGNVLASPNYWAPNVNVANANYFFLSKYQPTLNFASPFTSVNSIRLEGLNVSGVNAQTTDEVALDWKLGFTFYYQYEGED